MWNTGKQFPCSKVCAYISKVTLCQKEPITVWLYSVQHNARIIIVCLLTEVQWATCLDLLRVLLGNWNLRISTSIERVRHGIPFSLYPCILMAVKLNPSISTRTWGAVTQCNANIYFNRQCLIKNVFPQYVSQYRQPSLYAVSLYAFSL
jgi:hypothetical protein